LQRAADSAEPVENDADVGVFVGVDAQDDLAVQGHGEPFVKKG
jgi:hypothetical protein